MTVTDDSLGAASNTQTPSAGGADGVDRTRAPAGDALAFDQLMAAHKARIAHLVYRLLGWDQGAEDVVQDVFLAALRNVKKFRGTGSVSTWLTRIAINKCRSHWRRRMLWRKVRGALRLRGVSVSPPAEEAAMKRETFERVRRAVRALPPTAREVVVLRYLEGMEMDKIGEVLGVSLNVVQVRLHRARGRLKELLSGLGEERP